MFQPHIITKSCKTHLLDKFQYWKQVARCWGGMLPGLGTRCSKLRYKCHKPRRDFGQRHCFSASVFSPAKWREMVRIRNVKTLRTRTLKQFSSTSLFKLYLTQNRDILVMAGGSVWWPLPTWWLSLHGDQPWGPSSRTQSRAGKHRFLHCLEPLSNLTVHNFIDFYSTLSMPSHKTWLFFKVFSIYIKAYYHIALVISISGDLKNIQHTILLSWVPVISSPSFSFSSSSSPSCSLIVFGLNVL